MKHGYLAVDLFFVLSGFVMAMSYSHMFADGFGVGHYLTFLIRRLARVYPLYIAVTFLVVLLSLSGVSRDLSIHHFGFRLAANILLVQGWGLSESINGPAWSISVEFAAYLLFPLLLGIAGRASPLAIFGLCMAAVAWLSFLPDPQPGQPRWGPLDIPWAESPWPLVRCLAEFMLGLMTYRVMSEDLVRRLIGKSLVQVSIILAIVCLLFFHPTDVVIVALLPALILVLAKGDGASATFFGSPFVFFLGFGPINGIPESAKA